jgi:ADP-ribose pyrophosphatase
VLALCEDRVALVRTYRYPVGTWEWGIPRGFAHGDDAAETARRELTEEIGAEPDELMPLGLVTPNSGLLSSVVHLFAARYGTPVSTPTDTGEVADVRWVSRDELDHAISGGDLTDAFTLAAVLRARYRGLL